MFVGAGWVKGERGATEGELRAAMVGAIAKFVEWPREHRPEKEFVLGVSQDELEKGAFGKLENLKLQGRPVRVVAIHAQMRVAELQGCHLVFVSDPVLWKAAREVLDGQSVLLVTDIPGAARQGAAQFQIMRQDKRLVFEVSLRAVRRGRFELKSGLLRLAERVYR
ncbi:MAG: YfiR family protein [Verrucomicrobiota bacterium]